MRAAVRYAFAGAFALWELSRLGRPIPWDIFTVSWAGAGAALLIASLVSAARWGRAGRAAGS